MKSNKKHHGHVNPNKKQNQNINQTVTANNNQLNNLNQNEIKTISVAPVENSNNDPKNEEDKLVNKNNSNISADSSSANNKQLSEFASRIYHLEEPKEKSTVQPSVADQSQIKTIGSASISEPAIAKKLGIVIVEHNSQPTIKQLITSLQNLKGFSDDWINIYIWDDFSTDYSRAYVAGLSKHFKIHYIFNDDLKGKVFARNKMLEWVNDDFIIFIDQKDQFEKDVLEFFLQNCDTSDFMMLKRNFMHSISKQMVDAAVYKDKGAKIDTYLIKTPYSYLTGIFVKKDIYQKVRDLVAKSPDEIADIRFYEDMVVYPFWVYYSRHPMILPTYYHFNLMEHDEYLLTDTCQEEQHHDSLKVIYAIDKIAKDAHLDNQEFNAIKYVMDIRLIHLYWSTANRKKKENVNIKVQELLAQFIKPVTNVPELLSQDKMKLQLVSSIHLQRFFHLFHK